MADGMEDFQAATVEISAGRYMEAARLLRAAEEKAEGSKPAGPVAEIKALREQCEARAGFGI